jgi:hypothetical protein
MKVSYFADTDTLFIEFREAVVAETRDLDEDTVSTSMLRATSVRSRLSTRRSGPVRPTSLTSKSLPKAVRSTKPASSVRLFARATGATISLVANHRRQGSTG